MGDLNRLRAGLATAARGAGTSPGGVAAGVAGVAACALPGDGAAITLMSTDADRQTLTVTDEVIAAVEAAQYTVGEGPSLDAVTGARPVLTPDLADPVPRADWPGLADRLAGLPVAGLFAFPLRLGASVIGVALCYRQAPGDLDREQVVFALRATDLLTLALLRTRSDHVLAHDEQEEDGDGWLGVGMPGTRAIHQATGMVMVQLGGVTAAVAFARLRAHAFSHDATLEQVAADIVGRRLVLQSDDGGSL